MTIYKLSGIYKGEGERFYRTPFDYRFHFVGAGSKPALLSFSRWSVGTIKKFKKCFDKSTDNCYGLVC